LICFEYGVLFEVSFVTSHQLFFIHPIYLCTQPTIKPLANDDVLLDLLETKLSIEALTIVSFSQLQVAVSSFLFIEADLLKHLYSY